MVSLSYDPVVSPAPAVKAMGCPRRTPNRAFGNQGFGGIGPDCNAGSTGEAPASSRVHPRKL